MVYDNMLCVFMSVFTLIHPKSFLKQIMSGFKSAILGSGNDALTERHHHGLSEVFSSLRLY